jgi:hypothetical protein
MVAAAAWSGAALVGLGQAQAPARQVVKVHYTPKDQQAGRYQYVPFEVGPGATRLDIEYRYDRKDGTNVVDLGLFEPGPLDLGTRAYRGWSGGERSRIQVGVAEATPGYWPGPLPEGRWHVMLGLYKVAEPGVDVEVLVDVSHDPAGPAPGLPSPPLEPVRSGPAWYAGALHTHTLHSDGTLSARDLLVKAREEGLDFVALTDHNNTVAQIEGVEAAGLLRIVGEEVTTPGGHFNVWGLGGSRDYVDFRVLAGDPAVERLVAGVRARGGLVSINHPAGSCFACSWTHAVPEGVDALEISAEKPEEVAVAVALWDQLLRAGRRIVGVGTSDWHRGQRPLGVPCVRAFAPALSTPAILEAIRGGRVIVMASPRLPPPSVTVRGGGSTAAIGDTLSLRPGESFEVAVSAEGPVYDGARAELFWRGERVAVQDLDPGAPSRFTRWATAEGYLRVHVLGADSSPMAVTNPVWVRVATP